MRVVSGGALSSRERVDHGLLRRYHDHHDLHAREAVAVRCMPLVRSIAWGYRGRGEDLDDLVQAGSVGLAKAIDRFDPALGSRFAAFAAPTITGEVKRHFRDHSWAVHVPRSVQDLGLRVRAATALALETTGREPTTHELADRLGVPSGRVAEGLAGSRAFRSVPLDEPGDDGRRRAPCPASVDPGYDRVEDRDLIAWAGRDLDDRSRRMIDARWIDDRVQREIAVDHGVSPMLVSGVLGRALDAMHHRASAAGVTRDSPAPGGAPSTAARSVRSARPPGRSPTS